jgi:alkylation response protein AidB-like acyl-CoA dehydrogenase
MESSKEIENQRLNDYLGRVRAIAPLIREHSAQSESEAQLAPAIAEAFHDAGLYRIFLPAQMDGGDLTLPQSLRIYEEAASIDGSAGWNLAISSGGPLFGAFVSREVFQEIFADRRSVSCGSLNPTSQAVAVPGGFRYSGRATYASGSAQATWLMANAIVLTDGQPEFVDGIPAMRVGLFPIKDAKILQTWSVSGMRGTGSNDCVFADVFVPEAFTYESMTPKPKWDRGAFSNIPLMVQLGGSLAAVALGVARHAIEALKTIAMAKVPTATRATLRERPLAQMQVAQAEGLLRAARAYLYEANDEIWRKGEHKEDFDFAACADARLASVTAAKFAAQAVDLVYDAAGLTSIQTSSAIEHCWRDAHTITQHVVLSSGRYEIIGRVLFGLNPDTPII